MCDEGGMHEEMMALYYIVTCTACLKNQGGHLDSGVQRFSATDENHVQYIVSTKHFCNIHIKDS